MQLPVVGVVRPRGVGEHLLEAAVDGVLGLAPLLEQEEDDGVLHEGAEDEEDADHEVEVDRVQSGADGSALSAMKNSKYSLNFSLEIFSFKINQEKRFSRRERLLIFIYAVLKKCESNERFVK